MISLSRPSIRRRDMDAVLSCMVTDSLGPGSLADQLVTAVGDYLDLSGGIALRERSRAFAIAVDLLGLDEGTAVVLDPLVPHAYHAVLFERGLHPIYVDVVDTSLCVDASLVEAAVNRAVEQGVEVGAIVTHTTLGFVPEMEKLAALGLPMIEDISEGIGANTGEERVGRFGKFVIVGMEPDGVITAGGGTLLLAAGKTDRTALRRVAAKLPLDALLPDMNAALGLTQIREIEKFIARRAEIASVYTRAIMRGRHHSPVQPGDAENVFLSFPVLVSGSVSDVGSYARKKGVESRRAFEQTVLERYGRTDRAPDPDAPAETPLDEPTPVAEAEYPVARSLLLRCLQFPLYPSLTSKEVSTIERVLTTLP